MKHINSTQTHTEPHPLEAVTEGACPVLAVGVFVVRVTV